MVSTHSFQNFNPITNNTMGFFSWITQDTGQSISNNYSIRPTFSVTMTDDKGNRWREENYGGYGVFGGKDFYELLDEMNGGYGDRNRGINLSFSGQPYKSPSLSRCGDYYDGKAPESCPNQGYFYDE